MTKFFFFRLSLSLFGARFFTIYFHFSTNVHASTCSYYTYSVYVFITKVYLFLFTFFCFSSLPFIITQMLQGNGMNAQWCAYHFFLSFFFLSYVRLCEKNLFSISFARSFVVVCESMFGCFICRLERSMWRRMNKWISVSRMDACYGIKWHRIYGRRLRAFKCRLPLHKQYGDGRQLKGLIHSTHTYTQRER